MVTLPDDPANHKEYFDEVHQQLKNQDKAFLLPWKMPRQY